MNDEVLQRLTKAVREADTRFEADGETGTRSWLRDYLLPELVAGDLAVSITDHGTIQGVASPRQANTWGELADEIAAVCQALDGHHPERGIQEREQAAYAVVTALRSASGGAATSEETFDPEQLRHRPSDPIPASASGICATCGQDPDSPGRIKRRIPGVPPEFCMREQDCDDPCHDHLDGEPENEVVMAITPEVVDQTAPAGDLIRNDFLVDPVFDPHPDQEDYEIGVGGDLPARETDEVERPESERRATPYSERSGFGLPGSAVLGIDRDPHVTPAETGIDHLELIRWSQALVEAVQKMGMERPVLDECWYARDALLAVLDGRNPIEALLGLEDPLDFVPKNHLTPVELADAISWSREDVIQKCVETNVPIYQGKIDKTLFQKAIRENPGGPRKRPDRCRPTGGQF